jgi:signal transduction histidine kinase
LREARQRETLITLAGGVAHDFNNLLTTIVGYAQLGASEATDPTEVRHALDQIADAGTRAAELTRQLLAYTGEARHASSRIDATAEIARMRDTLAALLPSRARLELPTNARVPTVQLASPDLQELVRQLVANAGEALQASGGLVRVALDRVQLAAHDLANYRHRPGAAPGAYVRLAVSDNGAGMTPDTAERAFEPFFSTRFTGRGLGLAAVDGLTRANHGAIRLTSRSGNGTTVEVVVPAAPDSA